MGFSVSSESIANLKNQINIVDVIGSAVPIKRAGRNYKGVCPFHSERTPSFVVSEEKQCFTCFGCGAHGDVISFVQMYYNLEFGEALEKLSKEYGIPLERSGSPGQNLEPYYEINRMAARFWHQALTSRKNRGLDYMEGRGLSPQTMIKFGIGYADDRWDSLYRFLKSRGVKEKDMLELGLISQGKNGKFYDRFRNRVMFPIINTTGKVIGFGGRALDPDAPAKYLNSPESKVFKKKNNLYGLNLSKKDVIENDYIILVEGYMDVISLYQSGIRNVGASLGTALTENQARLIKRFTKNVVLSYDADSAGIDAALRGMEILKKEECKVKILHVAEGKDPDEYVKKNGKEAFLSLIDRALPYEDYKLRHIMSKFDINSDQGKIDFVKAVAPVLKSFSPVERDIYVRKLASAINISETVLNLEIDGAKMPQEQPAPRRRSPQGQVHQLSSLERDLISIALKEEGYLEKIRANYDMMGSSAGRRLFEAIEKDREENGSVDVVRVFSYLEEDEKALLRDIVENVPVTRNYEEFFNDCVKRHQLKVLTAREKELITLLDMAGNEEEQQNGSHLNSLTQELMEIQGKIRKLK